MVLYAVDDEPDSFVDIELVYKNKNDPSNNSNLWFDFQVLYTRAPEIDSDGEEDLDYDNLETLNVCHTHEFNRELLIGGDMGQRQIQEAVCSILEIINVPRYRDIVMRLTKAMMDLKNREVERIKVVIDVMVRMFPGEEEVDVKLAVAPASDEAVEAHLVTVVVENDEGYCVICMDTIRVESDVEAVRMPCLHVFHRTCGEEWLRNSGICPVCRAVFPS